MLTDQLSKLQIKKYVQMTLAKTKGPLPEPFAYPALGGMFNFNLV